MPLAIGTLLNNRYRIVSILGQGGMGAVYRASDEHLLIPVAVKENLFLTEEYGRQFQREAHILAGLRHPNLPHVSDYFMMENQGQYLVMDFVEGEDLRQRMERMGTLPEREAILIGISICDALTYLHTRQPSIVHRDIKPGNIKVTPDGQAVLVDFGLAKIMQGAQVTSTGARAMTPGYSPPEQYGTARTDYRSDIYSLGATLYATLTGVIPEDGLARMTGKARLTPVRELAPKVNRRLAETIERALEIDSDDRYQTAEDFKCALVESGELSNYYQDRPAISPPPSSTPVSEVSGLLSQDLLESPVSRPQNSLSRKQRARKRRFAWTLAPLLLAVVIGVGLLIAARPDLPRTLMAYFTASPTTAIQPTEIAAIQSSPTGSEMSEPTATQESGSSSANPLPAETSTPSPEPTISLTPTITLTSAPTATPRGGGLGQIAFASDRGGNMQIWLIDSTTKKARQITSQKDGACQPTWSPDGLRLAFVSPCPSKQDTYAGGIIYAINLDIEGNPDQSSLSQLTRGLEGDFDPAWSPDGKQIAFTRLSGQKSSIALLNLEDLSVTELSSYSYADKQPAWNPSGMQLAFVRQFLTSQIWFMYSNGEQSGQYSPRNPVNNLWPAWSADGQVIFYSQTSPDSNVPLLVYLPYEDRTDYKEKRIPTNPKSETGPVAEVSPSPDGFWLAFESWPDGDNHDIYIMNINGSNRERLTTDPGFDFGPAWRPLKVLAGAQP
jgi:serine/threonine protein kinase/Tol biopolymer transport system component